MGCAPWYGPQTTGAKSDLSRGLDSVKIASGSNLLEEMGRIEDLAAKMRSTGMTLDDHMLYCTQFSLTLCLPNARWRQGNLHLVTVSAAMISSRPYESDITDFLGPGRRGPMLAMPAMLCSPAAAVVEIRKGAGGGAHGKGGGRGKEKGGRRGQQGRGGTNEDGGGSAAATGGDGSSAKAAEGCTSEVRCYRCGKKGHWRVDCTEKLCSRCHGRGHAADVCPTSKEEAVLAASDDDDDYDTVEASVSKARETSERSDVLGNKGEGESAWQVKDEAWLCDSGASTHMTPSADGMVNYRECNLKLRIAGGSTRTIEVYGDINFVFRSGDGLVRVKLTNVAHMPDLRYHVFSLSFPYPLS